MHPHASALVSRIVSRAVAEMTDRYHNLTAAAVLLVAAIAAVISYQHVVALAIRYGQPALAAYLLPVSIDGLVAVSSLVMLRSARLGVASPGLARTGLILAIIATLACNVGYGVAHGWPGALLSGWPAVAFVVAAEVAITMTRREPSRKPVAEPGAGPARATSKPAARSASKPAGRGIEAAAEAARKAVLEGQPVPSARSIARVHHIGRDRASEVRREVLAASNGHAAEA